MSRYTHSHRVVLWFVLLFGTLPAWAGEGSAGDTDNGVPVRGKFTIKNKTGQTANDFHFYLYQNDRPSVNVIGASAGSDSFGSVSAELDSNNNDDVGSGEGAPFHGAKIEMDGGSVAHGEDIMVEIQLNMNERNCLKVSDIEWTYDDVPKPEPKRRPKGGWRVKGPFPGGGGGNPGDPGGGGQGAQEGDGGTDGNWVHYVCFENDSATDCMRLIELKLLASDVTYPDIGAIDWTAIDPVKNARGEPPVIIPPGGSWCFPLETTGSYLGGHVYLWYRIDTVPCPGSKSAKNGQADEEDEEDSEIISIGDHPNPDASLDLDGDGLWDAYEEAYGLDPEDDGTGDFDQGAEGNPDNDAFPNIQEQQMLTDPTNPDDPFAVAPGVTPLHTEGAQLRFGVGPSLPIPADFFGPGSDPFLGTILMGGSPVPLPSCPDLSVPVDTVIQRMDAAALPKAGSAATVPIELVELNLVSVAPITVTYNAGETAAQFQVEVRLGGPATGNMTVTRTHFAGGTFDFSVNLPFVVRFTEVDDISNVIDLPLVDVYGAQDMPWWSVAPDLDCPTCTGQFFAVYDNRPYARLFSAPVFFDQEVSLACSAAPDAPEDVLPGIDLLETEAPSAWQFGNGFPPIPVDFFNPGSEPFEWWPPLGGKAFGVSPVCPGDLGNTDTIIERLATSHVDAIGAVDRVPIEMVQLSLSSTAPLDIGGGELWNVDLTLSPVARSTGIMTITRTHADGGVFDAEMFVVPQFTFTRTDTLETAVLDGAAAGMGSYLRVTDVPWIDDSTGLLWPACSSNFVPGIDAAMKYVTGGKAPFTMSGGAGMFTFVPADSSGDSDGDGLSDFDEANAGTNANDPDSDDDGLPDGWEVDFGLDPLDDGSIDPNNGPLGDPDGDLQNNALEYANGTNPTVADGMLPLRRGALIAAVLLVILIAGLGAQKRLRV